MKLAYVDSSVWIARFEGLPAYKKIVNDSLTQLGKEGLSLCISQAVLLEVMPKPHTAFIRHLWKINSGFPIPTVIAEKYFHESERKAIEITIFL